MAEEKKPSTAEIVFYALDGETVHKVTTSQIDKLSGSVDLFTTEEEANKARDEKIRGRVLADHRKRKSKAKVEEDRRRFAAANPAYERRHASQEVDAYSNALAAARAAGDEKGAEKISELLTRAEARLKGSRR